MALERWVEFYRAHDCIARQPCELTGKQCGGRNGHGIGGVRMRMYARGPLGVVQFVLSTGWYLDETVTRLNERHLTRRWNPLEASAADLGYHSPTPRYDDQMEFECDLLDGGRCYYDGSGLNAERPWKALREGGHEAVWSLLEDYYREVFE